tara:strand:+ start:392 stop:514 length:123 start_codon:yes stop_codon:yes gene_type:complete
MSREQKITFYIDILGYTQQEAVMWVDIIGHGDEAPPALRD